MRLKRFGPSKEIEKAWHKCGNMAILMNESLGRESVRILSISIFKKILDWWTEPYLCTHTIPSFIVPAKDGKLQRFGASFILEWILAFLAKWTLVPDLKCMSLRHGTSSAGYFIIRIINRIGQRESIMLIFWPQVSRCHRPVHMYAYNYII